jgi:signal transduction histidine kinase
MSRRVGIAHWEIAVVVEAAVVALWIREPSMPLAFGALAVSLVVAWAAARVRSIGALASGAVAVAAAVAVLSTSLRSRNVEVRWADVRESLIQTASERLSRTLALAVDLAREVAARGLAVEGSSRTEVVQHLQALVGSDMPEHGVVIFDESGRPWAWAGRHRETVQPAETELSTRISPFYVVLEASRQGAGRTAVGHVVLAADSAVPDREGTVAWRFARETGSSLEFFAPGNAPLGTDVFDYCLPACTASLGGVPPDTLFSVRAVPPSQGAVKLRILATGSRWTAVLTLVLLLLLVLAGGPVGRWGGLLGIVAVAVLTPIGERIGMGSLFSPAVYFLDTLGPLGASAGAVLLLAALLVIGLLQLSRRRVRHVPVRAVAALLLVAISPYAMWSLARGITPPSTGVGVALWLSWQVTLTAAGTAIGLSAALLLGPGDRRRAGWAVVVAGFWAAGLAVIGLMTWQPSGDWPLWYGLLWIPAAWLAIQPVQRYRVLLSVTAIAGVAAAVLTWGAVLHGRLLLAERDARRLQGGDPVAIGFLERFQADLLEDGPPRNTADLYARWRRSPLSQWDYPGVLTTWGPSDEQIASLALARLDVDSVLLHEVGRLARDSGTPVVREMETAIGLQYVGGVAYNDGSAVTVAVAPRSQLIRPVLVGRFLRGEVRLLAPYSMYLGELIGPSGMLGEDRFWIRDGWMLRSSRLLEGPDRVRHLHTSVSIRDPAQLLVRGMLLVIVDIGFLTFLLLVAEGVGGRFRLPPGLSEALRFRSYRVRLTLALAAFFVIPTLGFAAWSMGRLSSEAVRRGDLLIQQTLSDAASTAEALAAQVPVEREARLASLAGRLGSDLLWYEGGALSASSSRVLAELGLIDPYLAPDVFLALAEDDALEITTNATIGGRRTRVGYRSLGVLVDDLAVLAAPRLVDVTDIQREQEDLAFGLLLVTLLGLGGAAGLAAVAARQLAKPVQSLRAAAVAVGSGSAIPPFDPNVPTEFASVVDAFGRMARDVEASQAALETARRRTATVLSTVATGVVALDRQMHVTIANPRAQELLDAVLASGVAVREATAPVWVPVWQCVHDFMQQDEDLLEQEFVVEGRRIRVQIAALLGDPRGCVVALDDTTELTRAVRVLAWGELARQVAHEIKNPLTPIRLGIQHLQRARRHGRADFDATLEQTGQQILAEIERLDAIARAFARFGAPPAEALPLHRADLPAIARDAAALYALGDGTAVRIRADEPIEVLARKDEVKEVLINLVENARNAGATDIEIAVLTDGAGLAVLEVRDNGRGISDQDLPHIFEPHFSTTTSGTGLGLAICRRLVESWGAAISVDSSAGRGTSVRIEFGMAEESA